MIIDKELILSGIKSNYKLKTDAEFARFLGIKPQTLAAWYVRNSFDIELLYAKCIDINPDWLLSGQGEILRKSILGLKDTFVQNPSKNVQNQCNDAMFFEKTTFVDKLLQRLEMLSKENGRLEMENNHLREQLAEKNIP